VENIIEVTIPSDPDLCEKKPDHKCYVFVDKILYIDRSEWADCASGNYFNADIGFGSATIQVKETVEQVLSKIRSDK